MEIGLQVETGISAALRKKKPEVARAQLGELVAEFPENPLFDSELAKIKVSPVAAISPRQQILPEQNVPHFTAHAVLVSLTPRENPVLFFGLGCTTAAITQMSLLGQCASGRAC